MKDLIRLQSTARYLETAIKVCDQEKIAHYTNDIFYLCMDTDHIPATLEDDITRQCMSYLRYNYSDPNLKLELLANRFNLSKNHLISLYKQTYHKTPVADLVDIRIERSKNFLKYPQYPIHWIAERCGFKNAYYFSNTFKKKTGISPTEFRQLALADRTDK